LNDSENPKILTLNLEHKNDYSESHSSSSKNKYFSNNSDEEKEI
jgi:hypothetical protein